MLRYPHIRSGTATAGVGGGGGGGGGGLRTNFRHTWYLHFATDLISGPMKSIPTWNQVR